MATPGYSAPAVETLVAIPATAVRYDRCTRNESRPSTREAGYTVVDNQLVRQHERFPYEYCLDWRIQGMDEGFRTISAYLPSSLALRAFQSQRFVLLREISLRYSVIQSACYVYDQESECWGSGVSLEEAQADYEENLLAEYQGLRSDRESLSMLAQERLRKLEELIGETQ